MGKYVVDHGVGIVGSAKHILIKENIALGRAAVNYGTYYIWGWGGDAVNYGKYYVGGGMREAWGLLITGGAVNYGEI